MLALSSDLTLGDGFPSTSKRIMQKYIYDISCHYDIINTNRANSTNDKKHALVVVSIQLIVSVCYRELQKA